VVSLIFFLVVVEQRTDSLQQRSVLWAAGPIPEELPLSV
jgi:hypothetical protein